MRSSTDKRRFRTINTEILKYFLIFSAALIGLLWLLEVVFLDDFYRVLRVHEVKKTSNTLIELDDSSFFSEKTLQLTVEKNISGVIFNKSADTITIVNDINLRTLLGNNFSSVLQELSRKITDHASMTLYILRNEKMTAGGNVKVTFSEKSSRNCRGIVYCLRESDSANEEKIIMVFGDIRPIEATSNTIRAQLMIVTGVMIVISGILSLIVSRRIARPIEVLNRDAQTMATGNYDIRFSGEGYSEIEELSSTLNDTAVQLQKADQVTKDLIANVSHDLRTPLTMISGYGEIIRDVPGENTAENVQVIIDEANRLTSLVNNLLDISKLQSGAIDVNITLVNISDLIMKVANTYSTMMESNGYRFELDIASDVSYVKGDSMRLEQVFHNLLNNAINHIGQDKTVLIRCHREQDFVKVEVIDQGEGIRKEDLPLIWQRYYKADRKHIRTEAGSGLGLSIVKTILDLHQAEYGVESQLNRGTNFWFKLAIGESEN